MLGADYLYLKFSAVELKLWNPRQTQERMLLLGLRLHRPIIPGIRRD